MADACPKCGSRWSAPGDVVAWPAGGGTGGMVVVMASHLSHRPSRVPRARSSVRVLSSSRPLRRPGPRAASSSDHPG